MKTPLHTPPDDYHEVRLLVATERDLLIRLNIAGIAVAVVALLLIDQRWRGVMLPPFSRQGQR